MSSRSISKQACRSQFFFQYSVPILSSVNQKSVFLNRGSGKERQGRSRGRLHAEWATFHTERLRDVPSNKKNKQTNKKKKKKTTGTCRPNDIDVFRTGQLATRLFAQIVKSVFYLLKRTFLIGCKYSFHLDLFADIIIFPFYI